MLNIGQNKTSNSNFKSNEFKNGCDLLIDSSVDSSVAVKYAHILEIIGGVSVLTKGHDDNLTMQHNLHITNILYSHDHPRTGEFYLLEFNHYIYIGNDKNDAIA